MRNTTYVCMHAAALLSAALVACEPGITGQAEISGFSDSAQDAVTAACGRRASASVFANAEEPGQASDRAVQFIKRAESTDAAEDTLVATTIMQDGACRDASLWLYDGPGLTGNRLCLFGAGDFDLGTVGWTARVRSYYAGSDAGWFSGRAGATLGTEHFEAYQRRPSAEPWAMAAGSVSLSNYVSLSSWNYPTTFVRHAYGLGEISTIGSNLDRADATFKGVPGLSDSSKISFESYNYPGYFLRHQEGRIKLAPYAAEALFRADATFKRVPGLTGTDTVSFESANYPGFFIRHQDGHLYIARSDGSALFSTDASFRVTAPWVH